MERMASARREVGKRHPVGPADLRVKLADLSCKPIGRKPFRHGICIEKCAIDPLGRHTEHLVKLHSTCRHDNISSLNYRIKLRTLSWPKRGMQLPTSGRILKDTFPAKPDPQQPGDSSWVVDERNIFPRPWLPCPGSPPATPASSTPPRC